MVTEVACETVLVVDDEQNARQITKLLLERRGYRVLIAADGDQGLMLAKVEQPHVILLDVMMPKMNGYETLHRLQDDPDMHGIPVIMVTARGGEQDIQAAFQQGAAFHIEKPYEIEDLCRKIDSLILQRKQQRFRESTGDA